MKTLAETTTGTPPVPPRGSAKELALAWIAGGRTAEQQAARIRQLNGSIAEWLSFDEYMDEEDAENGDQTIADLRAVAAETTERRQYMNELAAEGWTRESAEAWLADENDRRKASVPQQGGASE